MSDPVTITPGQIRELKDLFMKFCMEEIEVPFQVLGTDEYRGFARILQIQGTQCVLLNKVLIAFFQKHPTLTEELLDNYEPNKTD